MTFIGRTRELEQLENLFKKNKAQLAVIRGRRRIGKSRLVEELGKNHLFIRFSGIAPTKDVTAENQRQTFTNQLTEAFNLPHMHFSDWESVFIFLNKQITDDPTVILLDEISWMGSKDPTFLPKFKNAWDLYFHNNPQLVMILCGSVSTWIEENIIKSTAFFGRIAKIITLEPLSLTESTEFLHNAGFRTSTYEIVKLLSVFGGIPWYLENLDATLSADENIKELCLVRDGLLVPEFDRIFDDIFSTRGEIYKKIIEILVRKSCDQAELRTALNYSHSGSISKYLENLILCGFVGKNQLWSLKTRKPTKQTIYYVKDHFIRFYFRFIKTHIVQVEQNTYLSMPLSSIPGWDSITGLQLENLVTANYALMYKALKIAPEDVVSASTYVQKKTTSRRGCQIDYLVQTRTNVLYAVEIKFSRQPIRSTIISEMKDKLKRFQYPKHLAINPVLVHVNGVDDSVIDSNYFYKIIDINDWIC